MVREDRLLAMRERMAERGPDGAGLWIAPDRGIGLAHRRLAVQDVSDAGAQPMTSDEGNLRIVFVGEIYNHRELRRDLERRGHRFRSSSDTEVLLHLYAERGQAMLDDLRGMYAFALWDADRQGLFLACDPFGMKTLYLADDGQTLHFASQVKALLASGEIDTTPNPAGHVGFFLWGFVPQPHTLYRAIRALPAGTALWLDTFGNRRETFFCDIAEELREAAHRTAPLFPSERDAAHMVREWLGVALRDSVSSHLVSDVPISVFLSAGLDSTTLTALASEVGADDLRTVTLGFDEFCGTDQDEVPLAELVARRYGTRHATRRVPGATFRAELDVILDAMDQPSIDGVNTWFVSKVAAQTGAKVAISGVGGDELFGGYSSFRDIPRLVRALKPLRPFPGLGRGFRRVSAPYLKSRTYPKFAGLLEYGTRESSAYLLRRGLVMPWELTDVLPPDMVREGWRELAPLAHLEETIRGVTGAHQKVAGLELTWYLRNQLLRDTDWAGMAHGLEVRAPFVDLPLLRAVAPLFSSSCPPTKRDMALSPACPLPDEVLHKHKTGFTIPVNAWLHADLEAPPRSAPQSRYAFQPGSASERPTPPVRGWARMHRQWAEVVYAAFDEPIAAPASKASDSLLALSSR